MAAPKYAPSGDQSSPYYRSPDVVPDSWRPERPGVVDGLQPAGPLLGAHGPDQGYALTLAERMAPKLHLGERERVDDATRGCLGIALRRASMYSRAPVVHDVRIAFTIWGFFDPEPPAELLARRHELFEGVGYVNHHYAEGRRIADLVPEATLRMTPAQVEAAYPARWRELTGA
ncbi:MAG: hypothetical protein HKN41_06690 [Ilumatobacter sp.]|nr:hypothetical protein [Ilumatobacter sp.]